MDKQTKYQIGDSVTVSAKFVVIDVDEVSDSAPLYQITDTMKLFTSWLDESEVDSLFNPREWLHKLHREKLKLVSDLNELENMIENTENNLKEGVSK